MNGRVPNAVDEYIAAQPKALRPTLGQVRAAIRRAVPEAVEGIGYGMPGYKLNGRLLASLERELKNYEQRKGTIHLPLDEPVPVRLISRIARLRAAGGLRHDRKRSACPTEENPHVATRKTAHVIGRSPPWPI